MTDRIAVGPCAALLLLLPIMAAAEVFDLPPPGQDVVGALTTIQARHEDTLLDIARRHGLGYEDIVRANPDVDTWLPGEGTEVVLPTRYVLPPGGELYVRSVDGEHVIGAFTDANNKPDGKLATKGKKA